MTPVPPLATSEQEPSQAAESQRPYRSKRRRPCDACRRRKTACRIDSQPPCVSCVSLGFECKFEGPPAKRRSRQSQSGERDNASNSGPSPAVPLDFDHAHLHPAPLENTEDSLPWDMSAMLEGQSMAYAMGNPNLQPSTWHAVLANSPGRMLSQEMMDFSWPEFPLDDAASLRAVAMGAPCMIDESSSTVRSLDDMPDFVAQYFGLSGETDPYLIRHFHFASEGVAKFFKVHFRQASGLAAGNRSDNVPAHFSISASELLDATKPETRLWSAKDELSRSELNKMISEAEGQRLIALFLRFIFPSLPILSRSRLRMGSTARHASQGMMSRMPPYLLAAIFAISVQFCHHDEVLCVSKVYTRPAVDRLWAIALQGIMTEIHAPRLSVLQTILIYLQKPQVGESSAVADSPFKWSLAGFAGSLTSTLGLHLECSHWQIPDWEKRLRRRLWWASFTELTMRSLLQGFPNPIQNDNFDVGDLTDNDFVVECLSNDMDSEQATSPSISEQSTEGSKLGDCDFPYLMNLALIASSISSSFYTLRATKQLAGDLASSLEVARPLQAQLTEWYNNLPSRYQVKGNVNGSISHNRLTRDGSARYLQLSYLTLELFIYRAVLRPVGSLVPISLGLGENTIDNPPILPDSLLDPKVDAISEAAEGCAQSITNLTSGLTSKDIDSFWFPWSRICFATVSNFVVTLLVQAPSYHRAREARQLIERWRDTLRTHNQSFSLVRLGLLRLDAMHFVGLRNLTRMSPWAMEVIGEDRDQEVGHDFNA